MVDTIDLNAEFSVMENAMQQLYAKYDSEVNNDYEQLKPIVKKIVKRTKQNKIDDYYYYMSLMFLSHEKHIDIYLNLYMLTLRAFKTKILKYKQLYRHKYVFGDTNLCKRISVKEMYKHIIRKKLNKVLIFDVADHISEFL
jgi:hypothetical protein